MYIMSSIMETIGDVPSILNVLVACPAARQAARQWPAMMIKAILNGLAKEIRQIAVAILTVPVENARDRAARTQFTNRYLGHDDDDIPRNIWPMKALRLLAALWEAVGHLTLSFAIATMKHMDWVEKFLKGPHCQCDPNCASKNSGGHSSDYHWNHTNIDYVYGSAWR